jgi:transcriptional regulator with XRE-family HTH domain
VAGGLTVRRGYFAEQLRALRAEAGLTQERLAARAGRHPSTRRQFEYALREPSYGSLVKLAHGLGVSLSAFDAPPPPASQQPPKWRKKPK